jgi:hypothetical protein
VKYISVRGKTMKYLDGRAVMLGDLVDLGGRMTGVVIACFDDGLFAPDFPREKWGILTAGVMVNSEQAGLIHYPEPNVDLVLVNRAPTE